jgi:hypothetical protein
LQRVSKRFTESIDLEPGSGVVLLAHSSNLVRTDRQSLVDRGGLHCRSRGRATRWALWPAPTGSSGRPL